MQLTAGIGHSGSQIFSLLTNLFFNTTYSSVKKNPGSGIVSAFISGINKRIVKKIETIIDEMDDLILEMKNEELDFSSEEATSFINQGKLLTIIIDEVILELKQLEIGDFNSKTLVNRFILMGEKIKTIMGLVCFYNETKVVRKEIEQGKTHSIDEAFSI